MTNLTSTISERHRKALRHPVRGDEAADDLIAHGLHVFEITPGVGGPQLGLLSALTVNLVPQGDPRWVASYTVWKPDPWTIIPIPTEGMQSLRWLLMDLLRDVGEGDIHFHLRKGQTVFSALKVLTAEERLVLYGGH